MKRLVIILCFILFGLLGYSQVSNVAEYRIANATTAFGKNIPVGTKVYNIATGDYLVCTTATASTGTLTTASANFTKINADTSATNEIEVSDETYSSANFNGGTAQAVSHDDFYDFNHTADTDDDGLANKVDLSSAGLVKTAADGTLSLAVLGTDYIALEVDASVSNEGNLTVTPGTASTSVLHSNSNGSTDVTIEVGSGLGISESGNTITITNSVTGKTSSTEKFEEDDGTPTAHSLAHTAITAQGCRVSLNGATLNPTDYTLTTTTITLNSPVYQYDAVVITYYY